jgi:hypothetical protein
MCFSSFVVLFSHIGAGIAYAGYAAGKEKRLYSSPDGPDWLWSPPSLPFSEHVCSLQGVKQPGREVACVLSSAEVKNECSSTVVSKGRWWVGIVAGGTC